MYKPIHQENKQRQENGKSLLQCDSLSQIISNKERLKSSRRNSRGNIREGRDPLAGGTRTEMQHYTAHVTWPRRQAARVTARRGMDTGYGATIFREGVVSAGWRVDFVRLGKIPVTADGCNWCRLLRNPLVCENNGDGFGTTLGTNFSEGLRGTDRRQ